MTRRRSTELDLESYGTDKLDAGYLPTYDREFADLVDQPVRMFEIGVLRGGSLRLWSDYFAHGQVVGADRNPLDEGYVLPERAAFAQGDQTDLAFLDRVAAEHAPDGFDIVLDDASHLGRESRVTFQHVFEHHLKPGGIYLMEDWGVGYWPDWVDGAPISDRLPSTLEWVRQRSPRMRGGGKLAWRLPFASHGHGMVGVLKQAVDALGDPEHAHLQLPTARIERISISHGLAFLHKAA